jgi:hypothetical protein
MAARYSYQSSPYDQFAQYQYQYGVQSGPRRFFSAVGRFFSRLIVLTVILGAVGGVLFVLHQYGVLLTIARGANVETQYRDLERRVGAANWGNPLSIERPGGMPAEATAVATTPANSPESETAKPATVQAAATTEPKTSDGLPIASLDSLPTAPAKGSPEPVTAAALAPEAAPVKVARAEPTPVRASRTQRTARAPKPRAEKQKELQRSIPLLQPKPKPEPEPVAKAEPPPKPEPKPAPEPDPTTPRASDNPLKAAIRAAMTKK